jgi:hypothetical protein
MESKEKEASNEYSITACVFVGAVTFLPSRYIATIGGIHSDTQTDGRDL